MEASFVVAPVVAGFIYGGLAPAILKDLGQSYYAEAGIHAGHWAMWVFPNGSCVPVPTQVDTSRIPIVRVCLLFKRTLQKVIKVEMRNMSEADKFTISTALSQLEEMNTIGIA